MRRAADIALMRAVDRPQARCIAFKHRYEGSQIRQVIAAVVGVVEEKDVAFVNIALKELGHRAGGKGQRADMDRHMLGLCNQASVEVADRGREIAARIEDLRIGGAQHRLAHLLDDREKAVLNDRDGDGIDAILQRLAPGAEWRRSVA